MRYPLDGLPAPSDSDPRQKEVNEYQNYVAEIYSWKSSIQPLVDRFQDKVRIAEEERRRVEDENARILEERKKAEAEAEELAAKEAQAAKWIPINSLRKKMEEMDIKFDDIQDRVTDLEEEIDRVREEAMSPEEAVMRRLVELGYRKPAPDVDFSRRSVEEGEVPFEPPQPPKSNEELTEDCERMEKKLAKYNDAIKSGLKQLEEWRERNLTKDRSYHELVVDNKELHLAVTKVCPCAKVGDVATLTIYHTYTAP